MTTTAKITKKLPVRLNENGGMYTESGGANSFDFNFSHPVDRSGLAGDAGEEMPERRHKSMPDRGTTYSMNAGMLPPNAKRGAMR